MARKSTVAVLPEEVVAEVNRLIRDGCTIDEILRALAPLGIADVSRSAMGRYVKSARESMEKYRQAQEVAKVWVDRMETEPNGDVARLMPEMLRALAFQTMSSMGESDDSTSAQELMFLAKALKDVSSASKLNVDIELKMREVRAQAHKDALAKAAKVVGETARAQGMDDAQADFWMKKVLGIR